MTFINRLSWFVILVAAGILLLLVAVLAATNGAVDVLGMKSTSLVTPTPYLVGPTPMPGDNPVPSVTDAAPMNTVLPKRALFQSVPLPQEVSLRSEVIISNLVFGALLAILFGFTALMWNDVIQREGETLAGWIKALGLDGVVRFFSGVSGFFVQRGCLGLPLIMLVFALYGVIFAFLEPSVSIFSPLSVQLALVMAISVSLISLGGDMAQRFVSRFWRSDSRYGLYPSNLVIAVFTTLLSRLFNLMPGIMFGVPGGADIKLTGQQRWLREIVLAFTTLTSVLGLGLLGWALTGLIADWGATVYTAQTLEFVAPIIRMLQSIGLAMFTMAVQTAFYEMIPITPTIGTKVFRWNPLVWWITFVPVTFVFAHTILNPNSDFLGAFQTSNVRFLIVAVTLLMSFVFTLWLYSRRIAPRLKSQSVSPVSTITEPYVNPLDATLPGGVNAQTVVSSYESMSSTRPRMSREELGFPSEEPPVTADDTKPRPASPHDTEPKKPVPIPEPPPPHKPALKPRRNYAEPYAGLFPPPQPGDEDYMETGFDASAAASSELEPEQNDPDAPTETQVPPPPDDLPI